MDKYTYFWSLITITMAVFLAGTYRHLVSRIAFVLWVNASREAEEAGLLAELRRIVPDVKTIVREAVLQKRIRDRSQFLWLRHLLIFGGFLVVFVFDVFLTIVEKYVPIEYFHAGPGRAFLKFFLETGGLVLLIGLTLGIAHRLIYTKQEKSLIELRLLVLLWLVTVTGYLTEALRFVVTPGDTLIGFSFVGGALSVWLRTVQWPWEALAPCMWILHATTTLAFFASIPSSKFVHVFASPLGRSITQRAGFAADKRARVSEGLL